MAIDHPPEGAPRSTWIRAARHTLFVAVLALCGRVAAAGEVEDESLTAPPPDLLIEQVSPSPDGRWIAVQSAGRSAREHRLWLVDLASGLLRELPAQPPVGTPLVWSEGALRVEIADARLGRREMRWLDPATHEVLRTARSTPILQAEAAAEAGMGWAKTSHRRSNGGRRASVIAWLEHDLSFAVSEHANLPWQISREPGIVFYANHSAGVTTVMRRDMQRDWSEQVTTIDGTQGSWQVSPDGRRICVSDGERTHIISALDGSPVAGPWRAGELSWIESDDSRFCLLTVGGHHYLLDIDLDGQRDLGPAGAEQIELFVLPGDHFVLRSGNRIDLLDRDGRSVANLLPGRAQVTTPH